MSPPPSLRDKLALAVLGLLLVAGQSLEAWEAVPW